MLGQIFAVKLYVYGSILVFGGLLAQIKSYSKAGMNAMVAGYILMTSMLFRHLVVLIFDLFLGVMSMERVGTEMATSLILIFGSYLFYLGVYSIAKMDREYVAVGVVGCLVMSFGGVMNLLNE